MKVNPTNSPNGLGRPRRWLKLGIGVSVVLPLGAWLIWETGQRASTRGAVPSPASDTCASPRAPHLGREPGTTASYALQFRSELCSDSECVGLAVVDGTLEAQARPREANGDQIVDLRVLAKAVTGDLGAHLPDTEILATPTAARFSGLGALVELRTRKQLDAPTLRLLESVVREVQVPSKTCAEAGSATFSRVEELVTASVASSFVQQPDGLRWTRDRVLVWRDQDSLFPLASRSTKIKNSAHSVKLSGDGFVEQLSGRDDFLLESDPSQGELRLRTSIGLSPSAQKVAAAPAAFLTPTESGFSAPSPRSTTADDARIAGHTVASIAGELKRPELAADKHTPARSRLYIATSALLRQDEHAAEQVSQMVRRGHPDSEFFIAALGDAGTLNSAKLLAGLLDSASASSTRAMALRALSRVEQADGSVVAAIGKLFGDSRLGGTARLTMGALAYRAQASSPEAAGEAVQMLKVDYSMQSGRMMRADALRALGNAGSTAALELSRQASLSQEPIERAAAAQAMRRIQSDSADRLLATLAEDPESFVRRSALAAALYRDPTEILTPVVERVARLDGEGTVRREAIRVLVRWKADVASARATLGWVASNDPEQDLRNVATEGLSRFAN
jgi:HEAT repeat protein